MGDNMERSMGSNLEVSQSCNEVSVGPDYSVEDSEELDKGCDFVEAVKPSRSPRLGGQPKNKALQTASMAAAAFAEIGGVVKPDVVTSPAGAASASGANITSPPAATSPKAQASPKSKPSPDADEA